MRTFKPMFILTLIALLSSAVLPTHAQGSTPSASKVDMPLYAVRGPYAVGKSWFMLDKGTDNALILAAWYPALKQKGDQTGSTLTVPNEYQIPNMRSWRS